MKLTTIQIILQELSDNAPTLAEDKYTGMEKVNSGYRIHKGDFIPRAFSRSEINSDIATVVDMCFPKTMTWDSNNLWLTIKL